MSVRHAEVGSVNREAGSVTGIENSRNIRDKAAQRIQELISGGKLGEDGRLPTERELAVQFGVSRTTCGRFFTGALI